MDFLIGTVFTIGALVILYAVFKILKELYYWMFL
jgi:hypothetical protein